MNFFDIQDTLFNAFKTLNTFSGIAFLNDNNVVYNENKKFTPPQDKRWFRLTFLSNPQNDLSIMQDSLREYVGVLQIDICTPLDKGESEAKNKYDWIERLFYRGAEFDNVTIKRCYVADKSPDKDHYKTIARIEWECVM